MMGPAYQMDNASLFLAPVLKCSREELHQNGSEGATRYVVVLTSQRRVQRIGERAEDSGG